MKADIITLDAKKAGTLDLNEAIFGMPLRADILHRVVNWQLAKRRAGTHAVKFRADVKASTRKMYNQKGTGRARHSTAKVNLFRGGGRAFGPIVRDHGYSLPKKIRALGLKTALSAKQADGKLIVVDMADLKDGKTSVVLGKLAKLGIKSALFIDGSSVNENFKRAISNVPNVDVLPSQGANVYDILRRDILVLTKAAVEALGERLK